MVRVGGGHFLMLMALIAASDDADSIAGASATPPAVATSGSTSTFTGPDVTALPAGGSGSYTYAWTVISNDAPLSALSASSATTKFRFTSILASDIVSGVLRCTITDTVTSTTTSVDVAWTHTDTRTP